MRFAREGYPFIGAGALLAVAGWTAVGMGFGGAAATAAAWTLTALTLFTLWFFRDPDQPTPVDPGLVIAQDVGSGKELWRAELGAVATQPALVVDGDLIEVEIAGTPWMTLDKTSGEPVE